VFGHTELQGVKGVGILFGLLIMLSGLMPALFCRENPRALEQPKIKILPAFKETMKNRPFFLLIGIVFFILMGIFLVQPMALYISIYYLFHGDKSATAQLVGLAGCVQGLAGLAATPFVAWLGTRLGKVRTLLWAQGLLMLSSLLSWVLFRPACPYLSLGCVILLAPAMACVWILLGSMLADSCDYDELQTGLRREGLYGAIYSWMVKGSMAAVLAASGFLVAWAGIDPTLPLQRPEAVWWMRVLFAVIPPLFAVVSFICTWHYPLTEKRMHEIRAELNARQAMQPVI
jgi:GPH family glycoside/pentoside/hexuronide:cation symporter